MRKTVRINNENFHIFEEYVSMKNYKKSTVLNNLLLFFYKLDEESRKDFLNENDDNSLHDKPVGLYLKDDTFFDEIRKYGISQVVNSLVYYFINAEETTKEMFLKKFM